MGPLRWGTLVTAAKLLGKTDIVPGICPLGLFPKLVSVVSGPILRRCTPHTRASLKSSFLHPQFLWLHQPPPLLPHLNLNQCHRQPKHLLLLLLLLLPLLLLTLWPLQSANPQERNRPESMIPVGRKAREAPRSEGEAQVRIGFLPGCDSSSPPDVRPCWL